MNRALSPAEIAHHQRTIAEAFRRTPDDIPAEVSADLRTQISERRSIYEQRELVVGHATVPAVIVQLPMRCRLCPVCGERFLQAGNVTPHNFDTCQPRCAIELERYADEHDCTVNEAAERMRDER